MATNPPPENTEPAAAVVPNGTQAEPAAAAPALPEPKLPTHKDTSLKELLGKMDDYAPIVRPAVAHPIFPISFHLHLLGP